MCVIMYVPTGTPLPPDENIVECWDSNPDGGGLMYMDHDKKLCIFKSLDKTFFLRRLFEVHAEYGDSSPVVAHFRIGTSGGNTFANCHPFVVGYDEETGAGVGFMHNGILFATPDNRSDTRTVAEDVLEHLPDGWWDSEGVLELLTSYCGRSNKFAFLRVHDETAEVRLINADAGVWWQDCWFSNYSYVLLSKPRARKWWENFQAPANSVTELDEWYQAQEQAYSSTVSDDGPSEADMEVVFESEFDAELSPKFDVDSHRYGENDLRVYKMVCHEQTDSRKCEWCGTKHDEYYLCGAFEVSWYLCDDCLQQVVRETREKAKHCMNVTASIGMWSKINAEEDLMLRHETDNLYVLTGNTNEGGDDDAHPA